MPKFKVKFVETNVYEFEIEAPSEDTLNEEVSDYMAAHPDLKVTHYRGGLEEWHEVPEDAPEGCGVCGVCGVCGGPLMPMGNLWGLEWFRCRDCGMDTSRDRLED